MKLFQRLLVAPAALGLMAPLAANADVTSVSNNSEIIEARVDGVEAQLEEIQAGAFSSTTTMSGTTNFVVGYTDDDRQSVRIEDGYDQVTFNYSFELRLNTSFTGEDLLYTTIQAGNFTAFNDGTAVGEDYDPGRFSNVFNGDYLNASTQTGDGLVVDKLWYQFPVGDSVTVWVGPKIENSDMLSSAPSVYNGVTKAFNLGGNGSTYGSSVAAGFGAAYNQQVEDPSEARFGVSVNYTGQGATDATAGIIDDDSREFFLTQVDYGNDRWQIAAAYASKTNGNTPNGEGYDGYYHTTSAAWYANDLTSIGLRAYWTPESSGAIPQVSVGYDTANVDDAAVDQTEETEAWMVGLGWTDLFMDGNTGGFAFGSRQNVTQFEPHGIAGQPKKEDPAKDNLVWEAYYTFQVNDGVSITPAVFGGSDVEEENFDVNGAVVITEFRF